MIDKMDDTEEGTVESAQETAEGSFAPANDISTTTMEASRDTNGDHNDEHDSEGDDKSHQDDSMGDHDEYDDYFEDDDDDEDHSTNSANYVERRPELYGPAGQHPVVWLRYPSGHRERFILVRPKDPHEHDPIEDMTNSIKLIATEFKPYFPADFLDRIEKAKKKGDAADLIPLTLEFNKTLKKMIENGEFAGEPLAASFPYASHIWKQAYERTIEDPRALNQYKGFSKEVYGETNPILINDIISKQLTLRPGDVFIDLGSGIGNVVFQVAAQTLCKAHGIELKETPSRFALTIQREAEKRCIYYHKAVGDIYLRQGDFVGDIQTGKIIAQADVVFVNNFAFDANTNLSLMDLFLEMKEGGKIVCFKDFFKPAARITAHNENDPGTILKTRKVHFWGNDGVSWTSSNIHYFIHVIDRSRLANFQKRNEQSEGSRRTPRKPATRESSPQVSKKRKLE